MWSALLTLPAMLSPWAVSHDGRGGEQHREAHFHRHTGSGTSSQSSCGGANRGLKEDLSLLGMLQLKLFHIPSGEGIPENKAYGERCVSPRPRRALRMY